MDKTVLKEQDFIPDVLPTTANYESKRHNTRVNEEREATIISAVIFLSFMTITIIVIVSLVRLSLPFIVTHPFWSMMLKIHRRYTHSSHCGRRVYM